MYQTLWTHALEGLAVNMLDSSSDDVSPGTTFWWCFLDTPHAIKSMTVTIFCGTQRCLIILLQ